MKTAQSHTFASVMTWMGLVAGITIVQQVVSRFLVLQLCLAVFFASVGQVAWNREYAASRSIVKQSLLHCPNMAWLWVRAFFRAVGAAALWTARRCRGTTIILLIVALYGQAAHGSAVGTGTKIVGRILIKEESEQLAKLAFRNKAAAEWLCREMGEEGAENLLKGLGSEAVEFIVRHGPSGAALYRELGQQGTALVGKYGDDTLKVFESQGKGTAEWIARYGDDGVRLAGQIGVRQTETLAQKAGADALSFVLKGGRPAVAILTRHPELTPIYKVAVKEGSEKTLLETFEKGGDRFLNFVQRNWKGAGVAALCAAFITQPEAFTEPLADTVSRGWSRTLQAVANPGSVTGALLVLIFIGLPILAITLKLLNGMDYIRRTARRLFQRRFGGQARNTNLKPTVPKTECLN